MAKKSDFLFLMLAVFLLLPVIFFPVSGDLSIFIHAGKVIAEGGKPYVDFVDLKPPLIYYLFTLVHYIFGSSEISPRLFDFLYQVLTVFSIYFVIGKFTGDRRSAALSGVIYAVSYTALNFNQTTQGESLMGLLFIWITYFLLDKPSIRNYIAAGALTGIAAGFKYPVIIIIGGYILYDMWAGKLSYSGMSKKYFVLIMSAVAAFLLTMLPMIDPEIRNAYAHVLSYTKYYASLPPLNIDFIVASVIKISVFFGDNYSISMIILIFTGLAISQRGNVNFRKPESSVYAFNLILAISLFITIAIEKKFAEYHFSRMYVPLAVIAGLGLKTVLSKIGELWKENNIAGKLVLFFLILAGLTFSPVPRWLGLSRAPVYYLADRERYDDIFELPGSAAIIRKQHKAVANYINSHAGPDAKVVLISTGAFAINQFLDTPNISKLTQSSFYLGKYTLDNWDRLIQTEIDSAGWVIVQDNDRHLFINGHNRSSLESVMKKPSLWNRIRKRFREVAVIGPFHIYQKN